MEKIIWKYGPASSLLEPSRQTCSSLCFVFFGHKACGSFAPRPRIKPAPSALEGEVLTLGPPGKSLRHALERAIASACRCQSGTCRNTSRCQSGMRRNACRCQLGICRLFSCQILQFCETWKTWILSFIETAFG